ncbi:MAG TPA: TonB-dependent receptor, partial [Caldithrix abyssi]|nr:TonB-dependent receptor [Caldithrix abyssi]
MKHILLILLVAAFARGQNITVSGRVLSAETHEPLEGVNLYLKHTASGTASNARGDFHIQVPQNKTVTLVASYVGYAEKETTFTARRDTSLTIMLSRHILDGPIVTAVATQVNDPASSATFSEIRKEELSRRYTTQDIPELLAELPSTTFYSEGGNGIGYNYLSIRGFDQRRIAVMINGVPQNDPEDHNV